MVSPGACVHCSSAVAGSCALAGVASHAAEAPLPQRAKESRVPFSAGEASGTIVKGLAQRVAGHGSTAAAGSPHAAAAMAMAQQALRRQRQSVAGAPASAARRRARTTKAASSPKRPLSAAARLQAGLGGVATASFVSTGAPHPPPGAEPPPRRQSCNSSDRSRPCHPALICTVSL